jgi:hypothetical protein
VRVAEYLLGLLPGLAFGQERLGLPVPRVSGLEGMLKSVPGRGRRPPPIGIGPPLEPGLLSPGDQQVGPAPASTRACWVSGQLPMVGRVAA